MLGCSSTLKILLHTCCFPPGTCSCFFIRHRILTLLLMLVCVSLLFTRICHSVIKELLSSHLDTDCDGRRSSIIFKYCTFYCIVKFTTSHCLGMLSVRICNYGEQIKTLTLYVIFRNFDILELGRKQLEFFLHVW